MKTKCEDSSDQIHKPGTKCDELMSSYLYQYDKLFCQSQEYDPICQNSIQWASSHNTSEYWDPHNCTGSCDEPGYGCDACTNKEYHHCMKNNESVCLHPSLFCDGHQHCDDGSDEKLDLCYFGYVENGIIEKHATFPCPNFHYPIIQTVATVCNGIPECLRNLR